MMHGRRGLLRWVIAISQISWFCALMGGAPPPDSTGQTIPPQETATLERLIDALEKPLMESRRAVRAGRLELDSRYTTNKTQPVYEKFTTHYTVYFDRAKLRLDRERRFADHRVVERRIFDGNQFIRADAPSHERGLPAIEVNPSSAPIAKNSDMFHPNLVGLAHCQLLNLAIRMCLTRLSVGIALLQAYRTPNSRDIPRNRSAFGPGRGSGPMCISGYRPIKRTECLEYALKALSVLRRRCTCGRQ